MCGIVGYIGKRDVAPLLLEGLQRLEYRGYDSAGIVVTSPKTAGLKMVKAKGRVRELEARVPKRFAGTTGIAHTRWATHGAPSDENAHPHLDAGNKVAVVHNGIAAPTAAPTAEAELRSRHWLEDRPVLLALSAKRPHKNLLGLLEALALLPPARRPVLVLAAR